MACSHGYGVESALPHSVLCSFSKTQKAPFSNTRMVVQRQLVEPAVCLSDLYDVFLLDIVRGIRQNIWTMIYKSQWPPNSMRSLTVSD